MVEDGRKVLFERFDLADKIELDSRHAQEIVLQLPMRVEAAFGGCIRKFRKLTE